jgi:multidrug resistance efflux pump
MKTFYTICISAVLVLVVITISLRSASTTFFGIADAQEIAVNDEFAVEIKKIHVVPGQRVAAGDTLVELKTPELDMKIAEINRDLGELRKQKTMHAKMTLSEVRQLKSEQEVRVNELRGEIRELEAQLEANRKLVLELRSIKRNDATAGSEGTIDNPIAIRILQLKKALDLALDSSNIGENRLSNELSYQGEPIAERILGLQKELDLLMDAKWQSSKISPISGIVGVICFKEGEKVSPFTPICSLHTESPSFVRGYIHENVYSQVAIGQKVLVSSSANVHTEIAGEVIGVGARIVEFPVRLRKSPEMLMWGREITIKIPAANKFLLGERVMISLSNESGKLSEQETGGSVFGSAVYAQSLPPNDVSKLSDPLALRALSGIQPSVPIEASGIVYCADIDKYLVISDDTEEKKPMLFLMGISGAIEKEIVVKGAPRINDMEGITQDDGGFVYVMASQNANKKGNMTPPRREFIRAARKGEALTFAGSVDLSQLLKNAASLKSNVPWAQAITQAMERGILDIEGLTAHKGDLFLGIKSPLSGGNAMILTLGGAQRLFAPGGPDARSVDLWNEWPLIDSLTGASSGISDLHAAGDALYILSVAETGVKGDLGTLWKYRTGDAKPARLERFEGLKPEGITFNSKIHELCLTFDNGSKLPSQILYVRAK